jgi:outer membrane protein assembly factor BamB
VYTTPVVAGDLVYIGSCAGSLWAFEVATGTAFWTFDFIAEWGQRVSFHGDPLITDELIITGSDGTSIGVLAALERETGDLRWHLTDQRGFPSDLASWEDNLYVASNTDTLYCVDIESGSVRWSFHGGEAIDDSRWSGAPAAVNGRVFFGPRDGILYALSADSGTVLWERDLGAPVSTSILADTVSIYLGTKNGLLHQIDQRNGASLASIDLGSTPRRRLLRVGNSIVALVGRDEELVAVNDSLSAVIWRTPSEHGWSSHRPHLWQNHILVGDTLGMLWALSPDDGSVDWTVQLEGMIRGIGSADSTILVGNLGGMVYAIAAPRQ